MKVVLTGGGTGGHAYPAISIAKALQSQHSDCELLYIGGRGGIEERLAKDAGLTFFGISSRKLKKLASPDTILTAFSLANGFGQAFRKLGRFRPDVVIGTGGYASAAVVMAQSLRGGKTIILEQDVVPGRTNLWLSRFASRVCVSFEDARDKFAGGKAVVTGSPIRAELLDLPPKDEAYSKLGLDPGLFTVLVLGGSQGARSLNNVVAEAASELTKLPVQVIHQAGPKNIEEAEEHRKALAWDRYHLHAYLDDMRSVYAVTDFAMCRSGSSTIAELTAVGLPTILVPYPYAHADHQWFNAEAVARHGAAIAVRDSEMTPILLVSTIGKMIASPDELRRMSKKSRELGRPNAAGDIVKLAQELAG